MAALPLEAVIIVVVGPADWPAAALSVAVFLTLVPWPCLTIRAMMMGVYADAAHRTPVSAPSCPTTSSVPPNVLAFAAGGVG